MKRFHQLIDRFEGKSRSWREILLSTNDVKFQVDPPRNLCHRREWIETSWKKFFLLPRSERSYTKKKAWSTYHQSYLNEINENVKITAVLYRILINLSSPNNKRSEKEKVKKKKWNEFISEEKKRKFVCEKLNNFPPVENRKVEGEKKCVLIRKWFSIEILFSSK